MLALWSAGLLLDVRITISCRDVAKFEANPIFRMLVMRLGMGRAVALQVAVEASLAVLAGSVPRHGPDPGSIAIVLAVFGLAHVLAWRSNKRFLAGLV